MLQLMNVRAGYEGAEIIHGIDLEVKPGEIVTIIGPNGSGKSTVLRCIYSLCDIFSGRILWKHKDVTRLQTFEKILECMSYVPQGRQIFRSMTVQENLAMGAYIFRDNKVLTTHLKEVYETFPILWSKRHAQSSTLSGGQQTMLAIGIALVQNPQLLLLDEPTLGLHQKTANELFRKIAEIHKEGVSIVIVEQNAKKAVEIADRTYVLKEGRIALSGGKSLLKDPRVKGVYFG